VHLTRLALTDFRSYTDVDVRLESGVTIFSGPNGEGKTNLVEAVGYAATLASHRAAQDAPLIRRGAEQAIIRAAVSTAANDALVEIELNAGRANRVRLNRTPLARPREVLGVLRTVLFAPEDLALVKGDPGERRRFLDDLLRRRPGRLRPGGPAAHGAAEIGRPEGGPARQPAVPRGGDGHSRCLGRAPGPGRG
jgi:DNA replication and repair protein RecF